MSKAKAMRSKLLFFVLLTSFLTISFSSRAQDNLVKPERWNLDVRSLPPVDNNSTLQYSTLPMTETFAEQPPSTRKEYTSNGVFAISSSSRILPRTSTQSEVIITRHPLNPMILFASANVYPVYGGRFSEGVYVSTNGGLTWSGKDSLAGAPVDMHVGDPAPVIDKNGTFIMTHLRLNYGTGQLTGMDANYSNDNGATWSNSVTLLSGSQDKNMAATDDSPTSPYYGRSYCVWSRFTTSPIPITSSFTTNGGVSWSTPININVPAASHYSQGCDIRTGPNGEVYVCWANPDQTNSLIEDNCGFAKSTNGGVNWTYTNVAFDMNGIRGTLPTVNNIRVNSFPRIDVDRTCGPYAGYIYIVVSQKNLAPAGTDPDIVIHRSTNGGTTWSAGIKVNQDALNNGKIQYFPCVRVDETGAVNVFYYDNRNTVAPVMQNYMSRSTDGGLTFTDIKITDHNFTPAPIAGTATGYQGDYIGITSGGLGKIFCNWMDNSSGIYQSWIASVDVTKANICEDFSCASFNPTSNFYEEFSGTNYWSRQNQSAFSIGTGSAKFDSWNAPAGTSQSMTSYQFNPAANNYILFDHAYQPRTGGNVDSLIIETSTNGGSTFSISQKLWGGTGAAVGPLNTITTGGGQFTPTGGQWRSKSYLLPSNTNKVRLRGRSGLGNNIWLDNVCVKVLASPVANLVCAVPQGFYRPTPVPHVIQDTIRLYLKRTDFFNITVDSATVYIAPSACSAPTFSNALDGSYYLVFKHRNSIETWSSTGALNYVRGSTFNFDLVNNNTLVYGNNQALIDVVNNFYGMFGGDIDKNNFVDGNDVILVSNAASSFLTGYVQTDVTGDNLVDLDDILLTHNNNTSFVKREAPPGADVNIELPVITHPKDMVLESDAVKEKHERAVRDMEFQMKIESKEYVPNWSPMPSQEYLDKLREARKERSKNINGNGHGLE